MLFEDVCPGCGTPLTGRRGEGKMEPPVRPTVLCIDDDPLVLHFYRAFLESRGYRVVTAAEGLFGLATATRDRPDVILLDVMLRGLSGFDICRKLRAEPTLQTTPIILLTVWDQPSLQNTGRAAGATVTLRKPADPDTILSAIEQVLRDRSDEPRE
ncbi:MAG: hypothetical protein A2Z31_10515 [candidate division NC10 bacterium RBG_16_65_8]|nr:MAG: hypothetical protein A2Z31_10515 [candidate division NC10 bacterium RBG_16_65_8]